MSEPYRTIELANNLSLQCYDQTNRYFGDYHRVRVLVTIDMPAVAADSADHRLVRFEHCLERMGVSGADVARVRDALIHDFLQTAQVYLEQPDFARQYQLKQLVEKNHPV